jgi:hypothetical protein
LSLNPPPRDGRDGLWLEKAEDWRVIATSPPPMPVFPWAIRHDEPVFARMLKQI